MLYISQSYKCSLLWSY